MPRGSSNERLCYFLWQPSVMEVVQTIHVVHFDTVDGSSDCIPAAKFQMQLSEMAKVQVAALSGGWRRRGRSSVAFLGDPTNVFLDAPTPGKAHAAMMRCALIASKLARADLIPIPRGAA